MGGCKLVESNQSSEQNIQDSRLQTALGIAVPAAVSFIPIIGGPVSSIVSGYTTQRRIQRVCDFVLGMESLLASLASQLSDASDTYVKSEDFEELLAETLERVSKEHSEERRRMYSAFLVGSITSPGEPYDEQLRFLKTIDELQWAHLVILHAYAQEPDPSAMDGWMGSIGQTLRKRVGNEIDLSTTALEDLVGDLYGLKLIIDNSIGTGMTARGAEELAGRITPYGHRFMAFLREGIHAVYSTDAPSPDAG